MSRYGPADNLRVMIYQFRIKGLLDPQWTDWFGGMTTSSTEDGDTLLTGPVEPDGRREAMTNVKLMGRKVLLFKKLL